MTVPVRPTRRPVQEPARIRVVVVGGGIAGLAAAREVRLARPDVDVVVLEGAPRSGGKLLLGEVGGVTVDLGAESMLNRRPEAVELARAAGLGERLVHPRTISAQIWSRRRMHPMPRSLMGVPVDHKELASSGILSRAGLTRAAMDNVLPATDIGDSDVSVGWLIEQRFGRELLDRLVEPLLGGVYAGHAREISARAAVPQVVALLSTDKSLSRAAAKVLGDRDDDRPVFAGLEGGLGQLPAALEEGLDVRTGATVREMARSADGGWNLVVGPTPAPEVVHADAVVLATPAAATARLLTGAVPAAALELARIEYASMAVVTMAFPRTAFPAVTGSGFLVPPVDGRAIKAATYSFAKWDWVDAASDDLVLMRTSLGRHREEQQLQASDEELVDRSVADLSRGVGLSVRPVDSLVQRWGGGLPQYAVGHVERVRRIRQAVAEAPALAVCGAAYDGLGIPACIASAHLAATQVLDQLPPPGAATTTDPGE